MFFTTRNIIITLVLLVLLFVLFGCDDAKKLTMEQKCLYDNAGITTEVGNVGNALDTVPDDKRAKVLSCIRKGLAGAVAPNGPSVNGPAGSN